MDKQKLMTLAYWTMIAFVIATCIFVVVYLGSNAHQCLADPLQYYQDKSKDVCSCIGKIFS